MTQSDLDPILKAVSRLLKEEATAREEGDAQMREALDERLSSIDGNALIKTAAVALADANLSALREHGENVLLRRSKLVSGTLPPIAQGVDQ